MALGENHLQPVGKCRMLQLGKLQVWRHADYWSFGAIRSGSCCFVIREGAYFEHVHAIRKPAVRDGFQILRSGILDSLERDLVCIGTAQEHLALRQPV